MAQFNLGFMYANGQGVQQDYAEAVKWYRRAADQGDADAQFNLGIVYEKGQGVQQNYAEAAKWYRRAADQGDEGAISALARLDTFVAQSSGSPSELSGSRQECAHCSTEAPCDKPLKACSRCGAAFYCSRSC